MFYIPILTRLAVGVGIETYGCIYRGGGGGVEAGRSGDSGGRIPLVARVVQ